MTGRQISVLRRAVEGVATGLRGTAAMFEQQAGHQRQVNWLLKHKMIRAYGGRWVGTPHGRKILAHMDSL